MDSVSSSSSPTSPKRFKSSHNEKSESGTAKKKSVLAENARQMIELAEKALEAVHAMIELESATREAAGVENEVFLCNGEYTLDDALTAVASARRCAEAVLKENK